jgi:adenylate cyclase
MAAHESESRVSLNGVEVRPARRLAAILAADVVGYSRLMGVEEEGTLANLRAVRTELIDPSLAAHRGRLVKTTGDGFLVEFASVVDALRCAIEWQQGMERRNSGVAEDRRIVFRIGVNLGDVIVEGDDIFGDGVNVAARLQSVATPGTICISGAARDQVLDKLPLVFEDLGRLRVKNIVRPVQAFLVRGGAQPHPAIHVRLWRRPAQRLLALATIMAAAAGVGLLLWFTPWTQESSRTLESITATGPSLPIPEKPSIAVLPFDVAGSDPEAAGLGDALAETIISSLSKTPKMFVIARNSSFAYRGKPVAAQRVSTELGVRYLLRGSIQKSADRVRITAQLIDASTGYPLWSETYDRKLDDIFALQDDITLTVVTALQIELTQGEAARVRQRGTNNLRAWLLVNQSFEHLVRFTKEDNIRARRLAEEAIALDSSYPEAHVRLGRTHLIDFHSGWVADPAASLRLSIGHAQRALKLDANYPDTYHLLSAIYLYLKRHEDARLAAAKALDLSPNHSLAKAALGMALTYAGEPEAAIGVFKEAMRLSPIYPGWYLSELARAYFQTGRYDDAMAALQRRLRDEPNSGEALILLAASAGAAERMDQARAALQKFLEPRPNYTLRLYASGEFYKNAEDLNRVLDALRKAGLPE